MIPPSMYFIFYYMGINTPFIMRGDTSKEIITFLYQSNFNTLKSLLFLFLLDIYQEFLKIACQCKRKTEDH